MANCVAIFDPVKVPQAWADEFPDLTAGDIIVQSREAVLIDGVCKTLIGRPVATDDGVAVHVCNCDNGTVIQTQATPDPVTRDVVFAGSVETAPGTHVECECVVVPNVLQWEYPATFGVVIAQGSATANWGAHITMAPAFPGNPCDPKAFPVDQRLTFTATMMHVCSDDGISVNVSTPSAGAIGFKFKSLNEVPLCEAERICLDIVAEISEVLLELVTNQFHQCSLFSFHGFARWEYSNPNLCLFRHDDGLFYLSDMFPLVFHGVAPVSHSSIVTLSVSSGTHTTAWSDDHPTITSHQLQYFVNPGPASPGNCPCTGQPGSSEFYIRFG